MAAPVVENIRLNKASFKPGEKAILTFTAYDPDNKVTKVTVTLSGDDGSSGTGTIDLVITDPINTTVVDSEGRTWTKTDAQGTTQTWEATV